MEIEFRNEPGQRYPELYKDGCLLERYTGQTSRGRVWIFDEYVLKLDGFALSSTFPDLYDDAYEENQSLQEYLFLAGNVIEPHDRIHFPKVYAGGVWENEGSLHTWVLMERIEGDKYGYVDFDDPDALVQTMYEIAEKYRISDIHDGNWLVNSLDTPVFIDIGIHNNYDLREVA